MPNSSEEILYDIRLVERHIRKGKVDRKEHQKWLKGQEDLTEQVHTVDYEQITAEGAKRITKS